MRTFINGLLKGRATRWGFVAVMFAVAGLCVAWNGQGQYRLGGGFIGNPAESGGMVWSAYQTPLDSDCKTAALRVSIMSWAEQASGMLSSYGADTLTDGIGQLAMINHDTAKGKLVFYALAEANPPMGKANPPVVKAIWVWNGTITFTSRDTYTVGGLTSVYSPDADTNGDGLPEDLTKFMFDIPMEAGVTRIVP